MNKTFKKIVAMAAVVGMSLPMAVVPAFAATVTKYYADVDEITITYSEELFISFSLFATHAAFIHI